MDSDHSAHHHHDDSALGCCHGAENEVDGGPSFLDSRLSRAQLLQALGGGVALLATAGPLESTVARAASEYSRVESTAAPSQADHLCLIVLDGGRPDYITKNLASLPNLRSLIKNGRWYNQAWVGDLMSITPPGHGVIG